MTPPTCFFCTEPATAIKVEAEIDHSDIEAHTVIRIQLPICASCADTEYDGTEEFPGTGALPL